MKKAAVIAAAGWWGCGCLMDQPPPYTQDVLKPLAGCPDALLPLGDGETFLSRLAKQLGELGYEVYIGVGRPGCLWPYGVRDRIGQLGKRSLTKMALEFGRVKSPWNEAKVEYCRQFGEVIEIPEPDSKGKHLTFLKVLESMEELPELVMLVCGDSLFTDTLIREIDSRGLHIFFTEMDEVLILNKAGIEIWKDEILSRKGLRSAHYSLWYGTGVEVERQLKAVGIPYFYMALMKDVYPRERWDEQIDVDFPDWTKHSTYVQALEWMEKYKGK